MEHNDTLSDMAPDIDIDEQDITEKLETKNKKRDQEMAEQLEDEEECESCKV